jgi:hypothetical protein
VVEEGRTLLKEAKRLRTLVTARRFPPEWTIEEHNDACFLVKDATGQALVYGYFEDGGMATMEMRDVQPTG